MLFPIFCYSYTIEVESIWQAYVELIFSGYIEIKDEFTFKIYTNIPETKNGVKATQFLKMGDIIFGYEILYMVKKLSKEEGGPEKDSSYLYLQDKKGNSFVLPININTMIKDQCPIATLKGSNMNLWCGKSFQEKNKKYIVTNITDNKLVLSFDGNEIILESGTSVTDADTILKFEYK